MKTSDIALIAIAGALVCLALIPTSGDKGGKVARGADVAPRPVPARPPGPPAAPDTAQAPTYKEPGAAPPIEGVPHRFFPLVAGSSWTYVVRGPKDLVPAREWILKIAKVPEGDAPGILGVGFAGRPQQASVWRDGDAIRLDGLPFVEPMEFLGNRPIAARGAFLPENAKVVVGGVWNAEYEREVTYHTRGYDGNPIEGPAVATQKDRAAVEDFEEVVVPAGVFKAFRVFWLGRVSIAMKRRPVLDELTAEPYRRDTMWFAPGIGVIRRKVVYPARKDAEVVFDLSHYERPAP
jgi:hypothetical protein